MSKHNKRVQVDGAGLIATIFGVVALPIGWFAALGILSAAERIGLLPADFAWAPVRDTEIAGHWLALVGGPLPGLLTRLARLPVWLDFCSSFALTLAAVAAWGGLTLMRQSVERFVGGARIHEGGQRRGDGIAIADQFRISQREEAMHLLVFAASEGGKTTLIKRVIGQAIERGDRLLILDFKKDYTQMLSPGPNGPALIAPWDARSSRWQIGEDLQTNVARNEFLLATIPDGRDPHWASGARSIAEAVMTALVAERGADWGFGDLVASMVAATADLQALRGIGMAHAREILLTLDTSPHTRTSYTANIGVALSSLRMIAAAESLLPPSRKWSVSRWLSKAGSVAILGWLQEGGAFSKSIAVQIIQASIISILSEPDAAPEKRRTWLILDEIGQVGHVPALTSGLTAIRSKGGRIVLGVQTLAQVEDHYGKTGVTTWLGQTATKIISRVEAPEDQKLVQDLIGKSHIERRHVNHSRSSGQSVSWQRHEEQAIESHELARLGPRADKSGSEILILRGGQIWRQIVKPDNLAEKETKAPALCATDFLKPGHLPADSKTLGHVIDLERFRQLAPPEPAKKLRS